MDQNSKEIDIRIEDEQFQSDISEKEVAEDYQITTRSKSKQKRKLADDEENKEDENTKIPKFNDFVKPSTSWKNRSQKGETFSLNVTEELEAEFLNATVNPSKSISNTEREIQEAENILLNVSTENYDGSSTSSSATQIEVDAATNAVSDIKTQDLDKDPCSDEIIAKKLSYSEVIPNILNYSSVAIGSK